MCERLLDHNIRVQESACGSIATLVEILQENVASYLPVRSWCSLLINYLAPGKAMPMIKPRFLFLMQTMLQFLAKTLESYGRRSLRKAYDALMTVAEVLCQQVPLVQHAHIVLPMLFQKFQVLPDDDRELLPLMECIASLAKSTGVAFEPYAAPVFARCTSLVDQFFTAARYGATDPDSAAEFEAIALDAISGVIEGLGPSVESLVGRSSLVDIVLQCARQVVRAVNAWEFPRASERPANHPALHTGAVHLDCSDLSSDVRQSAFAVVGDLAKACAPHIKCRLADIINLALHNIEPALLTQENMSACNNACWCIGEHGMAVH